MGTDLQFLRGPVALLQNLDTAFTFLLLVLRFSGLLFTMPGMGGQAKGMVFRYPVILILSFASLYSSPVVPLPADIALMVAAMFSELALGFCIGLIPYLFVAIVQNAGQLSSTSMGLQAGSLMDPTTGGQTADIARLFGDMLTIAFLMIGGHRVLIYAVSGLGGRLTPGSFVLGPNTLEMIVQRSSDVFEMGMLLAAPVVVALLLTQFVMGLIAKAVPTVNVFIVSFPLTIGIGLVLVVLMIPELLRATESLLTSAESNVSTILQDAVLKNP